MKQQIAGFLLILAMAGACDDPAGPPAGNGLSEGSYEMTMTGDRALTRSGAQAIVMGQPGWVSFWMGTHPRTIGPDTVVLIELSVPPGLAVGTHPFHESPTGTYTVGGVFFSDANGITHRFESSSDGTVTITRKTDTGVEGEFSFAAEGYRVGADQSPRERVSVTGRFHASY